MKNSDEAQRQLELARHRVRAVRAGERLWLLLRFIPAVTTLAISQKLRWPRVSAGAMMTIRKLERRVDELNDNLEAIIQEIEVDN